MSFLDAGPGILHDGISGRAAFGGWGQIVSEYGVGGYGDDDFDRIRAAEGMVLAGREALTLPEGTSAKVPDLTPAPNAATSANHAQLVLAIVAVLVLVEVLG